MAILLVALLSGALSVLTPCVLPLLPAILAASTGGGRRRPIGIVLGLVVSFTVALLAFSAIVRALGIPSDTLRWIAAGLLLVFGAVLVVPALERRFELAASKLSRFAPKSTQAQGEGFWTGVLVGSGLGIVWAPCVGPIIAGVAVTASTSSTGLEQVSRAVAFALGMSGPLLIIVFGGRRAGGAIRARVKPKVVQLVAGVVFVATGAIIATGADSHINTFLSQKTGISSTLSAGLERKVVNRSSGGESTKFAASTKDEASGAERDATGLPDLGPAPDFAGITQWINTPGEQPLTLADLKGKVVLVDFWTYSCINCLRTLPHVKSWYSEYEQDGLVVIGVHAPEFEFEHDEGNVRTAVRDKGVKYPVAMDNDFVTWKRYQNQYWPAEYLIDKEGHVRETHFGEGEYDTTEKNIRALLGVDSADTDMTEVADVDLTTAQTPETYVGSERAERFEGVAFGGEPGQLARMTTATYSKPSGELALADWSFTGTWTDASERAIAGDDAQIQFHYRAADVYLVLGPAKDGAAKPTGDATVTIHDGDEPARTVEVTGQQLYTLREGTDMADQTMRIDVPKGIAVYAFTFG